ncbi:globin [Taibaiella sp. KBW10]|uniref:group III truncated hemoglobin n=1 Tax=Taibaiella sp. KBW10 TaxID=2153357 RepID=UPI000F5A2936|nr:group III truncated hemoglobin [Taibaiella sp. KBW10]RQO30467.1 globin [Taibaiella sp. KBW10]
MKNDIASIADVQLFVDEFYAAVGRDGVIGPIFEAKLQGNWTPHLEKMYRFWQTILLHEHTYSGSPFLHHIKLPIYKEHFELWLRLFHATIDKHFEGAVAEEAKSRAGKMAVMFEAKLDYLRNNPDTVPLV